METYDSSNLQQSEREESECIRETKGEEEKERELETINYSLYLRLTIFCFCINLCCACFGTRRRISIITCYPDNNNQF